MIVQDILEEVYEYETGELTYQSIGDAWVDVIDRLTKKSSKKNLKKGSITDSVFSMTFTNSKLKITQMMIIHLKQEDMIELMRTNKRLVQAMATDVDKDGNNCAHICLMYDKQDVFSQLIDILPELCDTPNDHGVTIYDYIMKFDRSRKLDERSYTRVMN